MALDAARVPQARLDAADGRALAKLAADTVATRLCDRPPPEGPPPAPVLAAVGASFVTLESHGRLRGCVGTIEASRPLYSDVVRNTLRAMRDPRLPPVVAADWPDLDVKVSVLTPAGALPTASRADLEAALRPGVDGVLLTDGWRRATFLPAVWAKLADPAQFVDGLLSKGGWAGWPEGVTASRYTTEVFVDPAPRLLLPQSFGQDGDRGTAVDR